MDIRSYLVLLFVISFSGSAVSYECKFPVSRRTFESKLGKEFHFFNFSAYHDYDEIWAFLTDLSHSFPKIMTIEHEGYSYEGREMKFVKISSNPNAKHPVILVEAGSHAREWASIAVSVLLIFDILMVPEKYKLDEIDWYIIPVSNPDGYQFSRSSEENRFWRKNRSKNIKGCVGVDLNRNYGYKWGSNRIVDCNEEVYPGTGEFSEVESRNLRNVMIKYADRIKLYIALHAFGNYLVYPYGYTDKVKPATWKILHDYAQGVADSIRTCRGTQYKIMSAGEWYVGAGGSDDFAFGKIGIPLVYTMEVSDGFGFTLPEEEIGPVFAETSKGFSAFAVDLKGYLKKIQESHVK